MKTAHFEVVADVDLTHWWFLGRREIMRRVLSCVVPPSPETLVIDVGCGTGANIASLAGSYECIGIDTSDDAIRLARPRFDEVKFIRGEAPQDLGEASGRAAAVLLMDVLEHVPDDTAVLGPLVDALSPGSHVLITVPADMRLWSKHDESLGHYLRYDVDRLRQMWVGMPVSEVMVSHFNYRLYPLVRAVRAWGRLRGRAWGREGSDMRTPRGPANRVLQRVFAGESQRLVDLVEGRSRHGYRYGVSLMALLRREPVHDIDRNRSRTTAGGADGEVG